MSSTAPSTLPPLSTTPPSSPSLSTRSLSPLPARGRPTPTKFNPFAPILPDPSAAPPIVRKKLTAAEESEKIVLRPMMRQFGEIGKEEDEGGEGVASGANSEVGEETTTMRGGVFSVGVRDRKSYRPMVRKVLRKKEEEDPSTVTLSEQLGGVALAKDEPATAPAAQEDAIATSVQADGAEITVTKEVPASKSSEEDDMKVD